MPMPQNGYIHGKQTASRSLAVGTVAAQVLCLAMLVSIASCSGGSYSISGGHIHSTTSGISASYRAFNGFYNQRFRLDAEADLLVSFVAVTESGSLVAVVRDSEGNELATLEPGQERVLENLPPGTYRARVEGHSHSGSFVLGWRLAP